MDISPFEQWKLRYIIHLAIYLNLNSPTDFFDEAISYLLFILISISISVSEFVYGANFQFDEVIIDFDNNGRTDIGDINGDGFDDIVVHRWGSNDARNADGALVWYKYPTWTPYTIRKNEKFFGDEVMIVDLDKDGDNDVVTSKGNRGTTEIWWFRNPGGAATSGWTEHHVGNLATSELKDLEVGDVDKDGKLDIVIRNRSKFAVFFSEYSDLMDRQNSGY
ncbi:MAG: FG-GAP repeat domain-containing protein [bacterium]